MAKKLDLSGTFQARSQFNLVTCYLHTLKYLQEGRLPVRSVSSLNRSWTSQGWPLVQAPRGASQANTLIFLQLSSMPEASEAVPVIGGKITGQEAIGLLGLQGSYWTMKIETADSSSWGSGLWEAGERPRPVAEEPFLTVECFQYRMISGMFSTGCSRW